jgi:hypothetical protein
MHALTLPAETLHEKPLPTEKPLPELPAAPETSPATPNTLPVASNTLPVTETTVPAASNNLSIAPETEERSLHGVARRLRARASAFILHNSNDDSARNPHSDARRRRWRGVVRRATATGEQQRLLEDSEGEQSVASSMDFVEFLNTTEPPPKDEPEDVLARPIPDWLLRGQETRAQRRERHRTERMMMRDRTV